MATGEVAYAIADASARAHADAGTNSVSRLSDMPDVRHLPDVSSRRSPVRAARDLPTDRQCGEVEKSACRCVFPRD